MDEWNFLKYDSSLEETLNKFRKAAKVHRKVRKDFSTLIETGQIEGMKYFDIANHIESLIEKESKFVNNDPFKSGIGFPIGLSINECAAHWTPNPGEKRVLEKTDLVKVDYGVHYDGCIIDSAFTFCLDNKYDELIKIGKSATELAIKNSGVDAILGEIGAETQEFIKACPICQKMAKAPTGLNTYLQPNEIMDSPLMRCHLLLSEKIRGCFPSNKK